MVVAGHAGRQELVVNHCTANRVVRSEPNLSQKGHLGIAFQAQNLGILKVGTEKPKITSDQVGVESRSFPDRVIG